MDGDPHAAPGDSPAAGEYLPLGQFGVTPTAVGDETIVNYDVPAFMYHGTTYTQIGVTSDGYLVAGGGTGPDLDFVPQHLPNPKRPNNVLAPFWTDLSGDPASGGGDGLRVGVLTDGVDHWIVVEWDLAIWGTTDVRSFQTWLGANGTEDISFVWNQTLAPAPEANGLTIGAENSTGTRRVHLGDAARRLERVRRAAGREHRQHARRKPHLRRHGAGRRRPAPATSRRRMAAPDGPGTYVVRTDVEVT